MSLSFFANNVRFALELLGAAAMLMAAWLTFDTYSVSKEGKILVRTVGFGLLALWQVIVAVGAGNDLLLYFGSALQIIGLACVLGSFLKSERLALPAILVIPPFAAAAAPLRGAASALLFAISYASYRQAKREFNPTWRRFFISFLLLGSGAAFAVFAKSDGTDFPSLVASAFELAGFLLLAAWVWQFLALRIRESLVIIFISVALLLSTVVTLAFSTILISQITSQTEANLLTDARVLDLSIDRLKRESLAEAALLAADPRLSAAVADDDFPELQALAERFMEQHELGFVVVTDARGSVLVRAHALSKRGDSLAGERAFEEALAGALFVTVETSAVEKLSIRAGAPIQGRKGKIIGAVIAGYPLDNALVDGIRRVTGLDMFVYEGDASVAATAFDEDGRTRLTGLRLEDGAARDAVLRGGESVTTQVRLRGEPFLASYLPLTNGDGKIVGMLSAAKPERDILDLINATNRLTLATVLLIMLALAYPIYAFTKRLADDIAP